MATDVLRKNRGLGMLLASMGSNKGGNEGGGTEGGFKGIKQESNNAQVSNVAQEYQGFDLGSSGFSGWGDISSNPRGDGTADDPIVITQESNNAQGKSGNTSAGAQEQKSREGKGTKEFQDEDVYGPKNMNRWADIKEYDDDHDSQWFEEENERLAKVYGGNFIYVKYLDSQPGRVGYYCQLCSAEMNAKKSLELHCSGMKHLKRKDQWEKGDQSKVEHGGNGGSSEKGPRQPSRWSTRDSYQSPAHTWSDRGHPRRESFGGQGHHMEPRPYRQPPAPEYRNDQGHFDRRDDYNRYSDNYYDDYYRKDMYRPQYGRDSFDGRRTPPDMRQGYDYHPGPARRDVGDRYSRERFNPYGRREAPPPPVISGTSEFDHGQVPRPPVINDVDMATSLLFEGISDGSCSQLLKKLSACRVKSWDDAALATNVVTFLVTSLREYYSKIGPPTIVHVLDEVVLKINILKDLQK